MIYLDNAATTPLKKEVVEAMLPYFTEEFYNPNSVYLAAQKVRQDLENARKTIADILNTDVKEIYFTGCGSESNNWAIKSGADTMKRRKNRIKVIISSIEHHSLLHSAEALEKDGFELVKLPVDEKGTVRLETLENAVDDNTALVSIIMGNNEIGTLQNIPELAKIAHDAGALFHTDAVQVVGTLPVDISALGVDMLSFSAHKFNGPKGVGALYVKKGTTLPPLIDGGGQERGKRAGTENVAGIIGMAKALELKRESNDSEYVSRMRDLLEEKLSQIPKILINGNRENRLPGIFNVSFEGIEGEGILLMLDMKGICASSGSACASGSIEPSHVLMAIGLSHEIAQGTVRFSLSEKITEQDINEVADTVKSTVERLRAMSPIWQD